MGISLREANNARAARRRFEARELINKIKSNSKCVDCGGQFHPCQMDFIRRDGNRNGPISRMLLKSKKRIVDEIKASDLVCANCGRLRVWNEQRARRAGAA
jgi:hypothetical protein